MWGRKRWQAQVEALVRDTRSFTRKPVPSPVRSVLRGLWRGEELSPEQREHLRDLASLAAQLETLTSRPEWAALLTVKEQLQALAADTSRRRPEASDDARIDRVRATAAAEWWGLEALFVNINRIIASGHKARETLNKAVTT